MILYRSYNADLDQLWCDWTHVVWQSLHVVGKSSCIQKITWNESKITLQWNIFKTQIEVIGFNIFQLMLIYYTLICEFFAKHCSHLPASSVKRYGLEHCFVYHIFQWCRTCYKRVKRSSVFSAIDHHRLCRQWKTSNWAFAAKRFIAPAWRSDGF